MKQHLHKYKKVNLSTTGREFYVYKCQESGCPHYVPITLAEGKECRCNRCDKTMTITKFQLTGNHNGPMKYPHCVECTRRKKKVDKDINKITSFLEKTTNK